CKFTKDGRFVVAPDDTEICPGTRCVAVCGELQFSWVKWAGGKPTQRVGGRIADNIPPPQRRSLGDVDPNGWEAVDGERRDPWGFQMLLPLVRMDTDEAIVFTTGSKGGLGAISRLSRAFGRRVNEGHTGAPVVELRPDHYSHSRYGRIFYPKFVIVTWL